MLGPRARTSKNALKFTIYLKSALLLILRCALSSGEIPTFGLNIQCNGAVGTGKVSQKRTKRIESKLVLAFVYIQQHLSVSFNHFGEYKKMLRQYQLNYIDGTDILAEAHVRFLCLGRYLSRTLSHSLLPSVCPLQKRDYEKHSKRISVITTTDDRNVFTANFIDNIFAPIFQDA